MSVPPPPLASWAGRLQPNHQSPSVYAGLARMRAATIPRSRLGPLPARYYGTRHWQNPAGAGSCLRLNRCK
jgi:hypothetical protein